MIDLELRTMLKVETDFVYPGYTLSQAIEALMDSDRRGLDHVPGEPRLRHAVCSHLASLDRDTYCHVLAEHGQMFLADEEIAAGHGLENLAFFLDWLSELQRGMPESVGLRRSA
ncbi:hypothetical protein EP7_002024 [Isosphaeraceae bacterium EP7]